MKLFFVRHGETNWNRVKRIQGQTDIPLNESGIKQAVRVAEKLHNISFLCAYTSPLRRAKNTATIILSKRNDCLLYQENLLKEIDYGIGEGQYLDEINKYVTSRLNIYFNHPELYIPPVQGETIAELKNRCSLFLDMMKDRYGDRDVDILVVSHGAYIRGTISIVQKLSDEDFWKGNVQHNCSVTVIEYLKDSFKLLLDAYNL